MELYLVRHAIADDGQDDDKRPLSPKGKKRFKQIAAGLAALDVRFDRVLHSPKLRALETAELLTPLLRGELEVTDLLAAAPGKELLEQLHGKRVALVGHEPWLSMLLAWLVTGDAGHGRGFELKKGSVARLDGDPVPGGMALTALLPPKLLREAGA